MHLEWTDPALDVLEIIRDYIAKDSPFYARRFIERIFDAEGSSDKVRDGFYQCLPQ